MKPPQLSPADFIRPPFITCPKCGAEKLGILIVARRHYTRRCASCFSPSGHEAPCLYPLPEPKKRVVYLDQFAISNMMKVLNPSPLQRAKATDNEYWLRLFERLDSLVKLQLLVCPSSEGHVDESTLSSFFAPLRRMYQQLSGGVSFYDYDTIQRFQVVEHARNWIRGKGSEQLSVDPQRIIHGQIAAWQPTLIVSWNTSFTQEMVDELRSLRDRRAKGLEQVFSRWQKEKDVTFRQCFEEEARGVGVGILKVHLGHLQKWSEIFAGQREPSLDEFLHPNETLIVQQVYEEFREAETPESEILTQAWEYFLSPEFREIPFVKVSAMLYASLARKASAGQVRPPSRGMVTDVRTVSALLPYCDAMFVDKECHEYLRGNPLQEVVGDFGTEVFSLNSKTEFLDYLDSIERAAPQEHLDKVKEVYGEAWREPYLTMYKS